MKIKNTDSNKKKPNKILSIIIFILILSFIIIGFIFINNKIESNRANKIREKVSKINDTKISYVFIDINPSLVMIIKGNKINDIACLNDDCINIYNEIDVKGKKINDGIDDIYNISKQKGFDTSNGVKVSSSNKIEIELKDYIKVEYIDTNKEKELLKEIKNNENIKDINNDNYNNNLLDELKKDSSYGKVYNCNTNEDNELECYIILETGFEKDSDYNADTEDKYNLIQDRIKNSSSKILNTLKKFDVDVRNNKVYINNIEYSYVPLFTLNNKPYKNVLVAEIVDKLDDDICRQGFSEYKNGKCEIEDGFYIILLNKFNLAKPVPNSDNMIVHRIGLKENILKNYEISNMMG